MAEHDEKKPTRVQARSEIKDLGQVMECRLREKAPAVEAGDMPHWRQESLDCLFERLRANLMELKACAGLSDAGTDTVIAPLGAADALGKAADISNLANLIRLRIETAAAQS